MTNINCRIQLHYLSGKANQFYWHSRYFFCFAVTWCIAQDTLTQNFSSAMTLKEIGDKSNKLVFWPTLLKQAPCEPFRIRVFRFGLPNERWHGLRSYQLSEVRKHSMQKLIDPVCLYWHVYGILQGCLIHSVARFLDTESLYCVCVCLSVPGCVLDFYLRRRSRRGRNRSLLGEIDLSSAKNFSPSQASISSVST